MSSKDPSKRPAGVNNPYAKRPPVTTAPLIGASSGINSTIIPSSAIPSLQPATFSQAFGTIDETTHYQGNAGTSRNPRLNSIGEQKDAEQRALHLHPSNTTTTSTNTSDLRDVHLQLQPHVLYVSTRQKGNGLLQYIRNVPFAFATIIPDYIMSATTCALFLSIKYHQLYPQYIHRRLSELQKNFTLRILLVLVDVEDCNNSLLQLNKLGVTQQLTVLLAWSEIEAARYLETFKALDGKDASSIQKREAKTPADQVTDFITACKPCSKTDAATVWEHFGTMSSISKASKDELALCPGLGPVKVQRLYEALNKPFSKWATRDRHQRKKKEQDEKEEKKHIQKESTNNNANGLDNADKNDKQTGPET